MESVNVLQNRVTELLAVARKVHDRQNTSVFISLEDFSDQKYYLYCSKEIWQRFLNIKSEGKRFIEFSKEEYKKIQNKVIDI